MTDGGGAGFMARCPGCAPGVSAVHWPGFGQVPSCWVS